MGNTRDYYADLELPSSADIQDVKKQFRKLALKYHPDRNPGREQEVNAKFQTIQTAHEILTDPTQKAKYDATLGRSKYPASSGVKGNPWSNVGQQFPTPPRRNQPGRNPPSGAQRYQSRFSSGVPPTAKQYTNTDPEAKKNAARAFDMRKPQPQANPKSTQRDRGPAPPPPPRSETARQRAQASFGNRKSGFYPRSSMPGDEPPVTNKNYSRSTAERPEAETQSGGRRPRPTTMPDPLSQFRDRGRDIYMDPRQSTPYTAQGGEKTNPFDGVPIGRAKSTRESSHTPDGDSRTQKPRSSSVPKKTAKEGPSPGLSVPTDGQRPHTAGETSGYAEASFGDPASDTYAPHSGTNTFRTAAGHAAEARKPPSSGTPSKGHGGGATGPSMYGIPQNRHPSHIPSCGSDTPHITPKVNPKSAAGRLFDQAAPSHSSSEGIPPNRAPSGDQATPHRVTSFEKQQHKLLDQLISNAEATRPGDKDCHTTTSNNISFKERANQSRFISFSFSVDDDTFARTRDQGGFSKNSVDDINTQFVRDEGSREWRFNAGSAEPSPSRSPGREGSLSPTKHPATGPDDDSGVDEQKSQPESGFNANGWSDKFGPQTFVPQATPGPSTSPTRAGRTAGKRQKATKPTAGSAAVVEDSSSDEERFEWPGRKGQAQKPGMGSPEAMDIDTPPPMSKVPSPKPNDVRNIPVEPSRPDWRPGHVDSLNGNVATESEEKKPFNPNAAGSEDSEEFRASLGDLKNVEPFAPQQNAGLRSLGDLKDNLPFESKASDDVSIKLPKPAPLLFPDPPVAPQRPPTVAIQGMKPNIPSWQKYLGEFGSYLQAWDKFNAQVVDHFATRNSHICHTRAQKGYSFLASRSDAEIQEYYNSVQQDNDVRRRWREACEDHEQRFREFMAFREKMKSA